MLTGPAGGITPPAVINSSTGLWCNVSWFYTMCLDAQLTLCLCVKVETDTGPGKLETVPPISTEQVHQVLIGRMKGIQGHCNSCYMDAALFGSGGWNMTLNYLTLRFSLKFSMLYVINNRNCRNSVQRIQNMFEWLNYQCEKHFWTNFSVLVHLRIICWTINWRNS